MNFAVAVTTLGPNASENRARSCEFAPSAAMTRSYVPSRRSSGWTGGEHLRSTPACWARCGSSVSSVRRATAAMPLPPNRHCWPRSRTSIGSQCTPCSVSARRSTGSAASMPSRVASEKTKPKPTVSPARLRSNTVTSRPGSPRLASSAASRPPGPPPRTAIRTCAPPLRMRVILLTSGVYMTHNNAHARRGNPGVKPRAIVWDLFGDHLRYVQDGVVPMRVLNQLLEVFGVGESTTRVVLSRMRREGWFTTSREGRQTSYALTGRSIAMLDEGRARIFDRGRDAWDGIWRTVIYAVPEDSRGERDRVRRTLAWHGFGPLAAATWISPHPRLETVRDALADLSATRMDRLESRALSRAADREMAFRCWDLDGLGRDYVELISGYEQLPGAAELAALPGPEALRRQVELVSSYRALPFRDPDLPAALLPEGWPGRRAHALFTAAHDALHGPGEGFVRGEASNI